MVALSPRRVQQKVGVAYFIGVLWRKKMKGKEQEKP